MSSTFLKSDRAFKRSAALAAILTAMSFSPVRADPFEGVDLVELALDESKQTYHEADIDQAAENNNIGATSMTLRADSTWTGTRGVSLDGVGGSRAEAMKFEFIDDTENFDPQSLFQSFSVDLSDVTGRTVTGLFIDPAAIGESYGEQDADLAIARTAFSVTAAESIRAGEGDAAAARIDISDAGSLTATGTMAFQNGRMSAAEGSRIVLGTASGSLGDTGSFTLTDSTLTIASAGGINSIGSVTMTRPGGAASSIAAAGLIGSIGAVSLDAASLEIEADSGIGRLVDVTLAQGASLSVISSGGGIAQAGPVSASASTLWVSVRDDVAALGAIQLESNSALTVISAQGSLGPVGKVTAGASSVTLQAEGSIGSLADMTLTGSTLHAKAGGGIASAGAVKVLAGSTAELSANTGSIGSIGAVEAAASTLTLRAAGDMGSIESLQASSSAVTLAAGGLMQSIGPVTAVGGELTISAGTGIESIGDVTLSEDATASISVTQGSFGSVGKITATGSALTLSATGGAAELKALDAQGSTIEATFGKRVQSAGAVTLRDSAFTAAAAEGFGSFGAMTLTGGASAEISSSAGSIGLINAITLDGSSLSLSARDAIQGAGTVEARESTLTMHTEKSLGNLGAVTLLNTNLRASAAEGVGTITSLELTGGSTAAFESADGAFGAIGAIRADASQVTLAAAGGFQSIGEVKLSNGAKAAIASGNSLGAIENITVDSSSLYLSNAQQQIGAVERMTLRKSGAADPVLSLVSEDGASAAHLRVANLNLESGEVRLGAPAPRRRLLRASNTLQYGSWLLLGRLTGTENGRITATGNTVVSLGADTAMLIPSRIAGALGDAATYADGGSLDKATLITTPAGIGSVGGVKILLGAGEVNAASSVTIGANARMIVDWTLQSTLAQGETSDAVYAGSGAEVILSGWNGESGTLSWLTGEEGASLTIVNSNFNGRASLGAGGLTLLPQSWGEVPGLHARSAMREVESRGIAASSDPGWVFIADAVDSGDHVGVNALANVIDSAVFLTAASGVTLAAEQALSETYRSLLMRRHSVPEGEKHWHALAWTSSGKFPKVFEGGSGRWGVSVKSGGGSLGADVSLNADWTASLSVSGTTSDTKSTGNVSRIRGEATSAAVTAMLTRRFADSELTFAVSAGQSQLEATQRVNKHILHTEPELRSGALSAIWQGGYGFGRFSVEPYVMAGVRSAKLKKGEVNDNRVETGVSGTGFINSAGRRLWAEAEAGAGLSATFTLFGANITPRSLLGVRAAAGDRSWKVRSCLQGASGCDEATFAGVSRVSARAALGVNIVRRDRVPVMTGGFLGFGAKPDGDKTEPREWMLDLAVNYERGSGREKSKGATLVYRQLF